MPAFVRTASRRARHPLAELVEARATAAPENRIDGGVSSCVDHTRGTSAERHPATPVESRSVMRKIPCTCLDCSNGSVRVQAQPSLTWQTIVNNADLIPGTALTLTAQPSRRERHPARSSACAQQGGRGGGRRSAAAVGGGSLCAPVDVVDITAAGPVHGIHALRLLRPAAPACRSWRTTSRRQDGAAAEQRPDQRCLVDLRGIPVDARASTR